jgi:hypothetical protein
MVGWCVQHCPTTTPHHTTPHQRLHAAGPHTHTPTQARDASSTPQGGSEKLSDEEIEETLDKVVKLLAYISDKDLFAEFYRKRLARRLLQVCVWGGGGGRGGGWGWGGGWGG